MKNIQASEPTTDSSMGSTRRQFIKTAAALPWLAHAAGSSRTPPKVLYSNDTTNITSCTSPFHKEREPFRKEMLEATVDEVTGLVDAHLLQPGLGMVPMWPSKVLPLAEHYAWIKQRYGQKPDPFGQFRSSSTAAIYASRPRSSPSA